MVPVPTGLTLHGETVLTHSEGETPRRLAGLGMLSVSSPTSEEMTFKLRPEDEEEQSREEGGKGTWA